jgi:hypothetical protein
VEFKALTGASQGIITRAGSPEVALQSLSGQGKPLGLLSAAVIESSQSKPRRADFSLRPRTVHTGWDITMDHPGC